MADLTANELPTPNTKRGKENSLIHSFLIQN